jgi:hypothetical protein
MKTIWGEHDLPLNKVNKFHIGPLYLWFLCDAHELRIAYSYEKEEQPGADNWTRWTIKEQKVTITLTPLLPDRSVIVQPENVFKLMAGSRVKIYVKIPLWIGVQVNKKNLIEIPSAILSNTWFGDFFGGELCYWISTSARMELGKEKPKNYLAIARVNLVNQATEDLPVEKLCLRVPNLSLFSDVDSIWAEEVDIFFKGEASASEIKLRNRAPQEAGKANLITKARQKEKGGLKAKAFASLKDLPGIGNFIS